MCWLYKSKCSQKGLAPVYLRITIDSERVEISTGVCVAPKQWNSQKGIVKGSSNTAIAFNKKLRQLKDQVLTIYNEALAVGIYPSAGIIKSKLDGRVEQRISLFDAVSYHNALFKKQVGLKKARLRTQSLNR
jgi:hypothetical protein